MGSHHMHAPLPPRLQGTRHLGETTSAMQKGCDLLKTEELHRLEASLGEEVPPRGHAFLFRGPMLGVLGWRKHWWLQL